MVWFCTGYILWLLGLGFSGEPVKPNCRKTQRLFIVVLLISLL